MKEPKLYGIITAICLSLLLLITAIHRMMSEPSVVLGLFTASVIALISILVSILIYSVKSLKSKENNTSQAIHLYRLTNYIVDKYEKIPTISELNDIIHIVNNIKEKEK